MIKFNKGDKVYYYDKIVKIIAITRKSNKIFYKLRDKDGTIYYNVTEFNLEKINDKN